MEHTQEKDPIHNRKRKQRIPQAELFAALEGLLPAAKIDIESRASYVEGFPDDEDHVEDVKFVQQGNQAIELAKRLIARKSAVIRRKQRALSEMHGQADA